MVALAMDGPGEYRTDTGSWFGDGWVLTLMLVVELALTVVGLLWLCVRRMDCMRLSHICLNAAVSLFNRVHLRLTWVRRVLSWASCWAFVASWVMAGKTKVVSLVTAVAKSVSRLP